MLKSELFLLPLILFGICENKETEHVSGELAKILEQMRAEMKNMQSTILLQDARINTQDARIKAQDAHTKAQDAHIKAQDAHIKAQDAKIAQQDARMAQLENQVGTMTNKDKESTNANNGLRGHIDATSVSMNDSLPNTSTKFRRNMIGVNRRAPEVMIGFQAAKIASQISVGTNQNIVFENVSLNLGNGYHPQHGVFIVPQSGIYVISATILHQNQVGINFNGAIVHQGTVVAKLVGAAGEWEQSSHTLLIQAQAGDEIWVKNIGPSNENIHGDFFSTFSGYMLWEL